MQAQSNSMMRFIGRLLDNVFIERQWRSLKYEKVYLKPFVTVAEAKVGIGSWMRFYNTQRRHQGLAYQTPDSVTSAD